ncbi:MAG: trigger factor [Phycisphaerales bacterium]|nr:trigger factor [Phycisphaerales bacterium]
MSEDVTTTEAEATGFEFKVEEIGPSRKRLHITVTADAVDEKLESSMGSLQMEAALPGFRKGRAPRHLIERRFGEGVQQEARNQLVSEAYTACLKDNDLNPLSEPEPVDPDADIELKAGTPLTFAVEVEVVPDFELPDLTGITIKRPTLEVEDSHIEEELTRQCMRHGSGEEIEKSFKEGDRMLGAAKLSIKGEDEPIFETPQTLVVLPEKGESGAVLGLLFEDLKASFSRKKVGDTITLETTGPEGHEREDIRGKDLELEFTIQVAERITPCTHQELIDTFSLASEDVLREQIRLALEQQRDEEQAQVIRDQAVNSAVELVKLDLPEKFSENQIARDLEGVRMELLQKGMEPDMVEAKMAEVRERSSEQTINRMKGFFLLARLAAEYEISVSEQELNGSIATMAMRQGVRPEKLRSELAKQGRLQQLATTVRDRKTIDQMAKSMQIEDISLDDWRALQKQS